MNSTIWMMSRSERAMTRFVRVDRDATVARSSNVSRRASHAQQFVFVE
jgi:hypothetical protein